MTESIDEIEGITSVEKEDVPSPFRETGIIENLAQNSDKLIKDKHFKQSLDAKQVFKSEEDIKKMVDKVKKILEALDANIDVKIKHYKDIPDLILGMQIVFEDKRTKKVIKEIPPEKLLKLYRELLEKIDFFLIDKKV